MTQMDTADPSWILVNVVQGALASRRTMRVVIAVMFAATSVSAQDWFRGFGGMGEGPGQPPRFPRMSDFDGGFTFCRLMYRQVRRHEPRASPLVGFSLPRPFSRQVGSRGLPRRGCAFA